MVAEGTLTWVRLPDWRTLVQGEPVHLSPRVGGNTLLDSKQYFQVPMFNQWLISHVRWYRISFSTLIFAQKRKACRCRLDSRSCSKAECADVSYHKDTRMSWYCPTTQHGGHEPAKDFNQKFKDLLMARQWNTCVTSTQIIGYNLGSGTDLGTFTMTGNQWTALHW